MNKWIKAFRIRTLPLALSSILMGGFVAYADENMRWNVLLLAIFTTLFLQILSNLANDYGDFVKGTDNEERVGPERALQSGDIKKSSMKMAIIILAILSLISGVLLIFISLGDDFWTSLVFLLIGILAILAAIRYTIGNTAYGYSGYGDLFVFIFFGWVAVIGSYFLISLKIENFVFLPATSIGLFSAAVLNLNNLRDHKNDAVSGKRTLVVKMGYEKAKHYHLFLLTCGWLFFIAFIIIRDLPIWAFLPLLSLPLFIKNLIAVYTVRNERELDPELKKLALSITLFTILFGIGIAIG